jgi:hypothetical protein
MRPKSRSPRPTRLCTSHRRTQTQQQRSKRWLEAAPDFGWKSHDLQAVKNLYVLGNNLSSASAAYPVPPPFSLNIVTQRLGGRRCSGPVIGGAIVLQKLVHRL